MTNSGYMLPEDITPEQWKIIHANYIKGGEVLDTHVDAMRRHLEEGGCTGPWCSGPEVNKLFDLLSPQQKDILLQQAVYRLAFMEARIEAEV